jgi:plasmid stability protein
VKNITVSLDDDSYRRARIKAAMADTSVSALVRDFLTRFAGEESEFEKLQRQEEELRRSVTIFRASDRLSREELHDRHAVS